MKMKNFTLFLLIPVLLLLSLPAFAQAESAENEVIPEKIDSPDFATEENKESKPAWGVTIVGLMLGGFLFMFIEIAIIPGFGIAGIIGLLMLGVGLALAFMKLTMGMAMAATALSLIGLALLIIWFFYFFPGTSMGKRFVLEAESSVGDGCIAVEDLQKWVGKTGKTKTMLRPSGIVVVDGERLDVMSDCEFIDKDKPVKIIRVNNGRMIVTINEIEEGQEEN
ncbi:MAG: NfeD family protein [Candidatus Rifleibacteriota bacterium]